jgi:CO/xanthine dehydrogenase Mo-binding subunit
MRTSAPLTRREFLTVTAGSGAGLLIGMYIPASVRRDLEAPEPPAQFAPNAWLRIDPSGTVTVTVAKSEMGQGVLTSLPMLVAEELDADWSSVRSEQAIADDKYGSMGTGGSRSVRGGWQTLREAGAAARMMLIEAAAREWNVDAATCTTESGVVHHSPSGRSVTYGAVAGKAAGMAIPGKIALKDPKSFRLIGRRTLRLDTPSKVDGSGKFGIDTRLPGMLYATVLHAPVYGAAVKSFDASKAKALPGVKDVLKIETGIAVIAASTWQAFQGRDALEVVWDEGESGAATSASIAASLREASIRSGAVAEKSGDPAGALASSKVKIEATFEAPFVAHATMEPMNCTADVRKDACEIWAPTQVPQGAQQEAATTLGIPASRVTVHTTLLGGGFGRRLQTDYVKDAVLCSRAAGAPVKMTWTREEDMQHDFYRPVSRHVLSGGIDDAGKALVLTHRVVAPSIGDQRRPGSLKEGLDRGAVEGAVKSIYDIPNFLVEFVLARTPVPIGAWRSVFPSQNVFALECFIDELAAAAGKDPCEFRLGLTANNPRAHGVLKLAAEKSGWGKPLPGGVFLGVACGPPSFFGSYVAQVAEISLSADRNVRVRRVVCAVDCGTAVNPESIEAQIEGGIVYGLSAALKGPITIERGRVVQSNFDDYPLLTMDEMPKIEVHIVPSSEPPDGIGEPGLPPIAPAVANAVSAATGVRVRSLPIRVHA